MSNVPTATVSRASAAGSTDDLPMCDRRSGQPGHVTGPCGVFADYRVAEALVCDSHLSYELNAALPPLPDDDTDTTS